MTRESITKTAQQHGVLAADTVLQVLSSFIGAEPMPMLKTIAQRAAMHPAKVHRYLVSLCRGGYVEQDAATNRYRLGPNALRLGFAAMISVDPIRVARPMMAGFAQKLQEAAVFAIWSDGGPTIALKETIPSPITITATEGTVLPLLRSSIGRAFTAWLPRARTEALLTVELAQLRAKPHPGCPSSLAEVETLIKEIRKRGLARVTGQLSPTAHSLSAPVFDSNGELAAVLCTLGPAAQFDSTWSGPTAKTLLESAAAVSRGLGYIKQGKP